MREVPDADRGDPICSDQDLLLPELSVCRQVNQRSSKLVDSLIGITLFVTELGEREPFAFGARFVGERVTRRAFS